MSVRRFVVLFAVTAALAPIAQGCQSGGVGDPCIPEDEYQTTFSGFDAAELNVESRSFQCETRVCLVNHFRGRVSCPLGMNETALAQAQADPQGPFATKDGSVCRIPGSVTPVNVTVQPQCTKRQAKDSVYCSCRCNGNDPNAKYCTCPSGYECTDLKEFALGAAVAKGSAQLSGSYCIRQGTEPPAGQKYCEAAPTVAQTQMDGESCTSAGNCKDDAGNPIKANP